MEFFKKQKIGAAMRLIQWQYEKKNLPVPEFSVLEKMAEKLVEDAGRISAERGGNILAILKDTAKNIIKDRS